MATVAFFLFSFVRLMGSVTCCAPCDECGHFFEGSGARFLRGVDVTKYGGDIVKEGSRCGFERVDSIFRGLDGL